jgi:stage II sporulation protein GA (sporulation sigma-E factor processing peptidase)
VVVYLDLLLLVNFGFNLLLAGAVSLVSPAPVKIGRLIAAALAGTMLYLIFFWFNQYIFIEWTCRLLGALVMAAIIYKELDLQKLVGRGLLVLATGQLLGGGIISVLLWSQGTGLGSPSLTGLPWAVLALTGGGVTILGIWALRSFAQNRKIRSFSGTVTAVVQGKSCTFTCLLDSGNCLKNPVNGWPVIILSAQAARELLPSELYQWCRNYETLPPGNWQERVTLIPYRVVGSFGLLPAVKPDEVTIDDGHGSLRLERVYMAVRGEEEKMSDFQVIAFPLQNREEGEGNDKLTG